MGRTSLYPFPWLVVPWVFLSFSQFFSYVIPPCSFPFFAQSVVSSLSFSIRLFIILTNPTIPLVCCPEAEWCLVWGLELATLSLASFASPHHLRHTHTTSVPSAGLRDVYLSVAGDSIPYQISHITLLPPYKLLSCDVLRAFIYSLLFYAVRKRLLAHLTHFPSPAHLAMLSRTPPAAAGTNPLKFDGSHISVHLEWRFLSRSRLD